MARNDPRLKLLFPNYVPTAELGGGRWVAGDLSLEALRDPELGRVARSVSADPADTVIHIGLERAERIGGLAVLGHNLSPSAMMVLQGFRDRPMTEAVYNAAGDAVEVYPTQYRWGEIPFGEPNWWTRKPLARDLGRVTTLALLILQAPVRAAFWRLAFIDPGNPAGRIEIGKAFLAPIFDPPHNYTYGATFTVLDESRMGQSLGGSRTYDKRGKRRRIAATFPNMKEKAEFGRWFDLAADAGITEEMIVIPDETDIINLHRRTMCATMREPTAFEQSAYLRMSAGLVFEEAI